MKKYKVVSISKENQRHEWICVADSKDDAESATLHMLNKVKGWSHYQYQVESIQRIKE